MRDTLIAAAKIMVGTLAGIVLGVAGLVIFLWLAQFWVESLQR